MLAGKYNEFYCKRFLKYVTKLILGYMSIILISIQIQNIEMNNFLYFLLSSSVVSLLSISFLFILLGNADRHILLSKIEKLNIMQKK